MHLKVFLKLKKNLKTPLSAGQLYKKKPKNPLGWVFFLKTYFFQPCVKVMKAIVKMLEDWMKTRDAKLLNQGPSLKEKSILLAKLMQNVEKRFPEDLELNGQFLEMVNFVYRDEGLKGSELTSKLEPAFLAGLRCTQPHIRAKFFEVFDASMRKRIHDRLMYVVCSQNWEAMGPHYWIKQCIELLLSCSCPNANLQNCSPSSLLPPVTGVIGMVMFSF
jgi:transformation/transcription domain-associated protein